MNVMAVCGLFFLIFAIFSVGYFKGDLRLCTGDVVDNVLHSYADADDPDGARSTTSSRQPQALGRAGRARARVVRPGVARVDRRPAPAAGELDPNLATGCAGGLVYNTSASETYGDWLAAPAPCCDTWPNPRDGRSDDARPTSHEVCKVLGRLVGAHRASALRQHLRGDALALRARHDRGLGRRHVRDGPWPRGLGMEPVRDHAEVWVFYWMFFMMIGAYLFLNLFVGVTLDKFHKIEQ